VPKPEMGYKAPIAEERVRGEGGEKNRCKEVLGRAVSKEIRAGL